MASVVTQAVDPQSAIRALTEQISKRIEDEAEAAIRDAVARYEAKLRREIGLVVMGAAQTYSMEMRGTTLEIRVRLEDIRTR